MQIFDELKARGVQRKSASFLWMAWQSLRRARRQFFRKWSCNAALFTWLAILLSTFRRAITKISPLTWNKSMAHRVSKLAVSNLSGSVRFGVNIPGDCRPETLFCLRRATFWVSFGGAQDYVHDQRHWGCWIDVNKVDTKSDKGEKISFKIIGRKKMYSGMKTLYVVKSIDILEQGDL